MLRTKLCQSQPLRQRSRDPEKEEQALLFMVQWGEMEDAGMELFGRIEWRMDAFDIDTALLSVSCLSLTPPSTIHRPTVCFNSMWLSGMSEGEINSLNSTPVQRFL